MKLFQSFTLILFCLHFDFCKQLKRKPKTPLDIPNFEIGLFLPSINKISNKSQFYSSLPDKVIFVSQSYQDFEIENYGILRAKKNTYFKWKYIKDIQGFLIELQMGTILIHSQNPKLQLSISTLEREWKIMGTTLLAQVQSIEKPNKGKVPCQGEGCKVKISVLEGTIKSKTDASEKTINSGQEMNFPSSTKTETKPISNQALKEFKNLSSFSSPNQSVQKALKEIRGELQKSNNSGNLIEKLENKTLEVQIQKESIEKAKYQYREKEIHKDALKIQLEE
jgi:hypothetical protein